MPDHDKIILNINSKNNPIKGSDFKLHFEKDTTIYCKWTMHTIQYILI